MTVNVTVTVTASMCSVGAFFFFYFINILRSYFMRIFHPAARWETA